MRTVLEDPVNAVFKGSCNTSQIECKHVVKVVETWCRGSATDKKSRTTFPWSGRRSIRVNCCAHARVWKFKFISKSARGNALVPGNSIALNGR